MIKIKFPSFGDRLKPIVFLTLGLVWVGIVHSQESATASGSGGAVAYSIGREVYTTKIGVSGSMSQGMKQANKFFTKDEAKFL